MIVHAISIRQPYVELILQGKKTREYRSRSTNIRGRVYLYASLKPKDDAASWRRAGKRRGELPTGAIVGSVEIAGCERNGDGYAYVLRDPKRLARPLRAKNQPQPVFWRPRF